MSHALNRTSPFGGPFIGTCFLCGCAGVTLEQMAMEECPNIRGLDPSEALIEAIEGPGPMVRLPEDADLMGDEDLGPWTGGVVPVDEEDPSPDTGSFAFIRMIGPGVRLRYIRCEALTSTKEIIGGVQIEGPCSSQAVTKRDGHYCCERCADLKVGVEWNGGGESIPKGAMGFV